MSRYRLCAPFKPTGDQPDAISALLGRLQRGDKRLTLEGVTGSGKTFTMAHVIAELDKPAIIMSHNKTLAAQLYGELKSFFPDNAVEYFVSYYDYYQPEAYIPQTDTYIEKDASINKEIERYRLSATNSLLSRDDVIIVASVSCIYGLGSPEDYFGMLVRIRTGESMERDEMLKRLVDIQYARNDYEHEPGSFRVKGDVVDIFPSYCQHGVRVSFLGDAVESIRIFDVTSGKMQGAQAEALISPAKHFVMPEGKIEPAVKLILQELKERVQELERQNKLLEAQRLQQRTMYDVEMLKEIGYCSGVENYSRHLAGRAAGEPPATLLDYFRGDFLTILDESHVTIPQLRGMYNGDQARKQVLVEHGFRLPSAKDNRPLRFEEFLERTGQIVFTTATPGPYEAQVAGEPVRQLIRPTGIADPPVEVRPLTRQVDDLMEEVRKVAAKGERCLVTTLTKRTAEDLSEYLVSAGLKVEYLHSDIVTMERMEILARLRRGDFDCLVGINLLREGLDLPEVSLVAILDADKEGFLRSQTALVQVAGRAARHVDGRVILYADVITDSMRHMIDITALRRGKQLEYNRVHGITPRSITKEIRESLSKEDEYKAVSRRIVKDTGEDFDLHETIEQLEREMLESAERLEFERAAALRDEWRELKRHIGEETTGKGPAEAGKKSQGASMNSRHTHGSFRRKT